MIATQGHAAAAPGGPEKRQLVLAFPEARPGACQLHCGSVAT